MSKALNTQLVTDPSAFSSEQYDFIYPNGIERHYWTKARNHIIKKELKKQKQVKHILEIGCGRGVVVDFLTKNQFDISGIELANPPIFPHLKDKIIVGADVLSMPDDYCNKFDTILLLDVIEHIEDPTKFLSSLKKKFKNLNTLLITVPARNEIFSNYDEFCGHYRRYDLPMIKKHLEVLQYNSVNTSYFFHALYLSAYFLLKLKRRRNIQLIPPKTPFMKFLHRIISMNFYMEYAILPKNLYGSSLIAVVHL